MCQEHSSLKSYMVFVCVLFAIFGASFVIEAHHSVTAVNRSNEVFRQYLVQGIEMDGLKEQHAKALGRQAGLSRVLQDIANIARFNPSVDLLLRAHNIYLTAPESK